MIKPIDVPVFHVPALSLVSRLDEMLRPHDFLPPIWIVLADGKELENGEEPEGERSE